MPQRLADALRAKPLDENSDGSEAALFAPRAQFLWQGLMQLNATLGVPRQPTPEGDTSAGDEPWQNHEAQLDELKTSSEHSDLLHDQRPPQLPTSQQLVQTHLQQRNRQGLPAGTPPHVGGPAAGQARAETVPEPKHSREPADSHLFGDEALAAALGVAKGRAAAAALAALADHLSRQVGGGGGCQSSVCSALRRIFPDAVGLSVAVPLEGGLRSLVSWSLHLPPQQQETAPIVSSPAVHSDSAGVPPEPALGSSAGQTATPAATDDLRLSTDAESSRPAAAAGAPQGSLLLLPAGLSAAGLALRAGTITTVPVGDEPELMDVQHAVRDMGAASMLCFPVLPGRPRTSSAGGGLGAARLAESDGTSGPRSDSMGLDVYGRERAQEGSIRLQEGGTERLVGSEAEQAYAAGSAESALGVLTLALSLDATMSRSAVARAVARAVFMARALVHTLEQDTVGLRGRAEAAAHAALAELHLPPLQAAPAPGPGRVPASEPAGDAVLARPAAAGAAQLAAAFEAADSAVETQQTNTLAVNLVAAAGRTAAEAAEEQVAAGGAEAPFSPAVGGHLAGPATVAAQFVKPDLTGTAGKTGIAACPEEQRSEVSSLSQRHPARTPPFPEIPDVVKPPKAQGSMDKAMAAEEWATASGGASAGGSAQTAALQFRSSVLEAEFATHHAALLARRVDDLTATVVVVYMAAHLLAPASFSAVPTGSILLPAVTTAIAAYFRWMQPTEYLERREWLVMGQAVVWVLHLVNGSPAPSLAAALMALALLFTVRLSTFLVTWLVVTVVPLARTCHEDCLRFAAASTSAAPTGGPAGDSGLRTGGSSSRSMLCAIAMAAPWFAAAYVAPAAGLYLVERLQRQSFLKRRRSSTSPPERNGPAARGKGS